MAAGQGSLDVSIHGDDLETQRIQLERNLQHTDLSFHVSAPSDALEDDDTVEHPRHGPVGSPVIGFISFERSSRDHFDMDDPDNLHAWSYRAGDNEESINPYSGRSLSTAGHHASAVTLNAGLGALLERRDVSLSGAEYDPDRNVEDLLAGANAGVSMLNNETALKKAAATVDFDLNILDNTAEIEYFARPRRSRHRSSTNASESSSASDDSSVRPRLADALQQIPFSPKRPRHASPKASGRASPHPLDRSFMSAGDPTPRPRKRAFPDVHIQPPTPSSSQFAKASRQLNREIEGERAKLSEAAGAFDDVHRARTDRPSTNHPRNPFSDIGNRPSYPLRATEKGGLVTLPDVTGLTSAVDSPIKATTSHHVYSGDGNPREADVRLLSTLEAVQEKLAHLETENTVSRRRIGELEGELQHCRRDVARERARIVEIEEAAHAASAQATRRAQQENAQEIDELRARYKHAVEDKKSLESLITSLRGHLQRLNGELSSHQSLLQQLRELRERDQADLKEKTRQILHLKTEVDRLSSEVEVLRSVVDDGLKERRRSDDRHDTSDQLGGKEQMGNHAKSPEIRENYDKLVRQTNAARHSSARTDRATLGSPIQQAHTSEDSARGVPLEPNRRPSAVRHPKQTFVESQLPEIEVPIAEADGRKESSSPNVDRPSTSSRGFASSVPHAHAPPRRRRRHSGDSSRTDAFPEIRGENAERLFFSVADHNARTCPTCNRQFHLKTSGVLGDMQADRERDARPRTSQQEPSRGETGSSPTVNRDRPPQTILAKVIRELEDDFAHYKSVYVELADQYKCMDAASAVSKRNALARHLHEVVDTLEQKGDQIASLYDLLSFKDRPLPTVSPSA